MQKIGTNQKSKAYVLFLPIVASLCILIAGFFCFSPSQVVAAELPKNQAAEAVTKTFSDQKIDQVIVGGQSIGIILQTQGAAVIGFAPVINKEGSSSFPGRDAGLKVGDFITMVNEHKVTTDDEISSYIQDLGTKGSEVILTLVRENQTQKINVTPAYCTDTETWRIGLYIRDNTAGVGTLTFYNPKTKAYGALGHLVADLEDKMLQGQNKGSILSASIQDIKQGKKGEPGEKVGVFSGNEVSGSIFKNSNFGIFGNLSTKLENILYPEPLEVAKVEEVKTGPAKIITVISGDKMEEFSVEIVKAIPSHKATGKGMVIKITDKRLLDLTGGIVQGMSGSPIIQDGKLVGAVTHVFVNDPTSGYGCFAEWMVDEINF